MRTAQARAYNAYPRNCRLVQTCDLLMRSMAKEHIVSLVDRATGYADVEIRDELTKILAQYIAPHLMPYLPRFPNEFFRQVYRIHGWPYVPGNRRMPQYVGKFINKYIYGYLPDGVLEKLQELNPVLERGWRATQNHRFLTDQGLAHLDRQITSTTTIMALSESAGEFDGNFHKVHRKPATAGYRAIEAQGREGPSFFAAFPADRRTDRKAFLGVLSTNLPPIALFTTERAVWLWSLRGIAGLRRALPPAERPGLIARHSRRCAEENES
jgi:hypothetical protein